MDLRESATVVATVMAIYGAALSTYNLLSARRDRARTVKVSLKWGIAAPRLEPETVFISEAANPRGRPVTLTGCGILLPNRKAFVIPQPMGSATFPHELAEGKNCTVLFPLGDVVRGLQQEGFTRRVELHATFSDALGKEYRSKSSKGDVAEWAKAARPS